MKMSVIMQMHIKPEARQCPRLTHEQITLIKTLFDQGLNYQAIADQVGCSLFSAWYHCQLPETLRKYREKAKENKNMWQKGRYRRKVLRYARLYEEGMLE